MTQSSLPWTGLAPGDAGAYAALTWEVFQQYGLGLGGARANVGPFLGSGTQPNDGLRVQAKAVPNTQVEILAGSALVQGVFYLNTATITQAIAGNASGSPRIDTIILRADYIAQTVRQAILQGTPAGSPVPLALTQVAGVTWEIPLADIAVANGFVTITQANITPRHEWVNAASGIYLDNILNNSGGVLQNGDVVIWDTSTDRAVTVTTTIDDPKTAGVWIGRTANGGYGRVLKSGIGYVNSSTAVTRGKLLTTSATSNQAQQNNGSIQYASIGRALETTVGAGFVLTLVDVRRITSRDFVLVQDQKANTTGPASITQAGWRTRELTTEVIDTAGIAAVAGNQITLQPGNYEVWASAPGSSVTSVNRLRLRDTTAGATLVQGSNSGESGTATPTMTLYGFFTLTTASALELQHWTSATGNGGQALSTGEVEVYANVFIQRIGEATT